MSFKPEISSISLLSEQNNNLLLVWVTGTVLLPLPSACLIYMRQNTQCMIEQSGCKPKLGHCHFSELVSCAGSAYILLFHLENVLK